MIKKKQEQIMYYKTWLNDWIANYIMPAVKSKTFARYVDIVEHHLIPKLGHYDLEELTPFIVQKYISELMQSGNLRTGKGLSANSVNSIITVIQSSLVTAFKFGFVKYMKWIN